MERWRCVFPRTQAAEDRLLALRAAATHLHLPASILQPPPIHTWLETWSIEEMPIRLSLQSATTKQIYAACVHKLSPSAPRFERKWSDVLAPTSSPMRCSWYKALWAMHLPRKWTDIL